MSSALAWTHEWLQLRSALWILSDSNRDLTTSMHELQDYAQLVQHFLFFSPRRFERAIRKRPNTVKCLAVKRTLLGTRHPRKEKEAALQNNVIIFCVSNFSRFPELFSQQSLPFSRACLMKSCHFTAKHLTVFGLFRIALSKRRAEKNKKKKYLQIPAKSDNFRQDLLSNKL